MQCLIIIGSEEKRKDYIKEFTRSKKIKNYNTHFYSEKISINDVREIKKILSVHVHSDEYRLFVFSLGVTQDAQHALLKTFEEVTDDSFFLLEAKTKEVFLPTVLSRSRVIMLGGSDIDATSFKQSKDFIEFFLSRNLSAEDRVLSVFKYCEVFAGKDTQIFFDNFILALRDVLLNSVMQEEYEKDLFIRVQVLKKILSRVLEVYPLVVFNNVNKRLVLEAILLGANSQINTP